MNAEWKNILTKEKFEMQNKYFEMLRSKNIFQLLIQDTTNHIQVTDRNGIVRFINFVTEGYKKEDVLGTCVFDIIEEESSKKCAEVIAEVLDTRKQIKIELKDLYDRSYIMDFYPFEEDTVLMISMNITEMKKIKEKVSEIEEHFKLALVEAPIPVMIHTADGDVQYINQVWTDLTGYTHKDIPTITKWVENAYEDSEKMHSVIGDLYDLKSKNYDGTFDIRTKDERKLVW